ncbi:MAG: sodium:calcium antiporter [Candidatus Aenigmatarchaeota archaeon]
MLFINFVYFLIACFFLAIGGNLVVRSLSEVARHYQMREFVLGFVLVAISTSIPELFVGIFSALDNVPAISFGDVIGANIVDLTIVIGFAALLGKRVFVEREINKDDILYTTLIAFLPILLFFDQQLSRIDGLILLSVFALYIVMLVKRRKHFHALKDGISKARVLLDIIVFIISLAILLVSAKFVVETAEIIAIELAFPEILVGLIIVSIGTTLPELSFEVNSVRKGFCGMALGDLLGSVVINSCLVLGIASLIYPITAEFLPFLIGSIFLMAILGIFAVFAKTGRVITRKEGLILILFYVMFVVTSILAR